MQPHQSRECGIACIKMITDYDQKNLSYQFIKSSCPYYKSDIGMTVFELGVFFLAQDYQVNITSMNMNYLHMGLRHAPQDVIFKQILDMQELYKKRQNELFIENLERAKEFISEGGTLIADVPVQHHIEQQLEHERPVIISYTSLFLMNRGGLNSHFSLVTGQDEDSFYLTDPGYGMYGDYTPFHKKDAVLYAMHANIANDVDNGALLTLKPR